MFKRRSVVFGLAALPLVGGSLAALTVPSSAQSGAEPLEGDVLETSAGDVTIHPVSHASLLLTHGDHVIYVDPVGGAEPYRGLPAPTSILITHQHPDHFDVPTLEAIGGEAPILTTQTVFDGLTDALKARTTVIANGESGTLEELPVNAVPAYNTTPERAQYHPMGVGNGYVLTFGDKTIYIAGDTEDTPEMRALTGITVAFLPMNLPFTMSVEQAADAVKAFKPEIVYPYHFRGQDGLSDLESFTSLVGDASEVRIRDWYPEGA